MADVMTDDEWQAHVTREAARQVELNAKLEGYLQIQQRAATQQRRLDALRIPATFDYPAARGLSYESIEKLGRVRPTTVGQASRVPGVRPSDIALLIGFLGRSARD